MRWRQGARVEAGQEVVPVSDQAIVLTILAIAVAVFFWNRIPGGIVALGVALSLWATDVVTLDEALAGFSNPTVILVAGLFVVAEGLDAAGITTWAGRLVGRHAGESRNRLMVLIMGATAGLSALITPNGAVAALYPLVVAVAVRSGQSPSQLLMPAVFAAHAGALLVLTGLPASLLIADAAADAGVGRVGYFEIALVGVPLLIGTVAVGLVLGARLLPVRDPSTHFRDLADLPASLKHQYLPEGEFMRVRVTAASPIAGMESSTLLDTGSPEVRVLSVIDSEGDPIPMTGAPVPPGARITIRGSRDGIARFVHANVLEPARDMQASLPESGLVDREFGVAEVIITPRSAYVGDRVFPGMVTDSGKLVVLAVLRLGTDLGVEEVELVPGDALLLYGRWDALDEYTADPNIALVDAPDIIRRQTIPLGPRAVPALAVLGVMVVLLSTGIVPPVVASLLAASAMVLLKVVTVDQAHRSMSWTTLIIVAGMIPMSTAITESGTAETIASGLLDATGGGNPYVVMTGLFLVTAVVGQFISKTVTALALIPIAVALAFEGGYSPMTILMSLNVGVAAALLTPIATPANLMVMGPAGYRFGDYWRFGLPVMAVYFLVAVFLVPMIWPL